MSVLGLAWIGTGGERGDAGLVDGVDSVEESSL